MQKLFNTLSFKINGSYLYAFYEGARIKRCIPRETNIIDDPTVSIKENTIDILLSMVFFSSFNVRYIKVD